MPSGKKHTFIGRTVQGNFIFFQGLRSIVFQEASNYSIEYGHFDYGTYGNAVAFVQEPSVDAVINYVISLGAGKRLWTFTPTNPALSTLQIVLDFPGTNTENAPPYKPIWYLSYSLGDFGGGHPPFSANGTEYNITVNPALTCYNSDAQVLMEGWEYGPRTLTRQSENLYTYFDETLYRENSLTPWSYANQGSPFVTSLTVAPFPWQAEWPAPFTATKTCIASTVPGAPNLTAASCPGNEPCDTLLLYFSAPESDGGSPITDYEYSLDNGDSWISLNTTQTDTDIYIYNAGIANFMITPTVRAVNAIGAGPSSNGINFTCEACIPSMPRNVNLNGNYGDCQMEIYYQEPDFANGTISHYEISVTTGEGEYNWVNIGFDGLDSSSAYPVAGNAGSDTRYVYVSFRAVNETGAGASTPQEFIAVIQCPEL